MFVSVDLVNKRVEVVDLVQGDLSTKGRIKTIVYAANNKILSFLTGLNV